MQRISSPDLYICCMQNIKKKRSVSDLSSPSSLCIWRLRGSITREQHHCGNPSSIPRMCEDHWICLVAEASEGVFPLKILALSFCLLISLVPGSLISPGVNGRGVLVMQMPRKHLHSNSSHGSVRISFSSPSHSSPLHSQQCPA